MSGGKPPRFHLCTPFCFKRVTLPCGGRSLLAAKARVKKSRRQVVTKHAQHIDHPELAATMTGLDADMKNLPRDAIAVSDQDDDYGAHDNEDDDCDDDSLPTGGADQADGAGMGHAHVLCTPCIFCPL